ncbi:hypothetical protein BGZ94_001935 [Podila epigama]|nr:hypothetical protein BGZ94_001935 [Podila epigama]
MMLKVTAAVCLMPLLLEVVRAIASDNAPSLDKREVVYVTVTEIRYVPLAAPTHAPAHFAQSARPAAQPMYPQIVGPDSFYFTLSPYPSNVPFPLKHNDNAPTPASGPNTVLAENLPVAAWTPPPANALTFTSHAGLLSTFAPSQYPTQQQASVAPFPTQHARPYATLFQPSLHSFPGVVSSIAPQHSNAPMWAPSATASVVNPISFIPSPLYTPLNVPLEPEPEPKHVVTPAPVATSDFALPLPTPELSRPPLSAPLPTPVTAPMATPAATPMDKPMATPMTTPDVPATSIANTASAASITPLPSQSTRLMSSLKDDTTSVSDDETASEATLLLHDKSTTTSEKTTVSTTTTTNGETTRTTTSVGLDGTTTVLTLFPTTTRHRPHTTNGANPIWVRSAGPGATTSTPLGYLTALFFPLSFLSVVLITMTLGVSGILFVL